MSEVGDERRIGMRAEVFSSGWMDGIFRVRMGWGSRGVSE